MIYIAATVTADKATVLSLHHFGDRARAAIDVHASLLHTGELMALPVSMARPGSKRPKRGDVLATTSEASGLVAVAAVE